ncbi:hypothetical protein ZOSMA_160G00410 [Zostera marina]|uniref:Uncharacterized protein n=1 Tax=Zostera marina TaxID=29655 RepID=A0A0K9PWV0_ZOSMR|nr:hypothetical protein ZOSMA_160G00410 [Zostera marina]
MQSQSRNRPPCSNADASSMRAKRRSTPNPHLLWKPRPRTKLPRFIPLLAYRPRSVQLSYPYRLAAGARQAFS